MGRGKLGEAWRAPNASWGVAGAEGSRAGFSEDFQGAARQADTPAWRRGLANNWILPWRAGCGSARLTGADGKQEYDR